MSRPILHEKQPYSERAILGFSRTLLGVIADARCRALEIARAPKTADAAMLAGDDFFEAAEALERAMLRMVAVRVRIEEARKEGAKT